MRAGRDFSIEYEGWQERGNFPSFLELRSSELGGLFVSWMGSLIVGGVVLRSDALARALIDATLFRDLQILSIFTFPV